MKQTIFIKRFIATDGLPKKRGWYFCFDKGQGAKGRITALLFDPDIDEKNWEKYITWWLEEKELPDEAEMENFIKTHPDNTGNFIIGAAVDAGFRVGAKWLKQQITK